MIRKIGKSTLGLVIALFFLFLSLFGLGDYLFPDAISRRAGDEVEGVFCFSFEQGETEPLSAQTLQVQTKTHRLLAFGVLPIKTVDVSYYPSSQVVCGGELFGVRMSTKGLLVTGLGTVETASGAVSPGEGAGIQKGDILVTAQGVVLQSASDFAKMIAKTEGGPIKITLERSGQQQTVSLSPVAASDGSGYKAGLWVRDGAAGIGTVTFLDPVTGAFGGLGHAVCDGETGTPFPLSSGTVCCAVIEGISKGDAGAPGEIRGRLEKSGVGKLYSNTQSGVFGTFNSPPPPGAKTVSIGLKGEIKPGKATIFCTLDKEGKKEYEIEIEEIIGMDRETKNFIVHVTDPELLAKTGGIIQGMSGSPIIQNGKLIGAVTHVLVGDPTRGYGIFIENMLKTAQGVAEQNLKAAS